MMELRNPKSTSEAYKRVEKKCIQSIKLNKHPRAILMEHETLESEDKIPVSRNFNAHDMSDSCSSCDSVKSTIRDRQKGRFTVIVNKNLPNPTKIEKFAMEPEAFYYHKSGFFFKKLESPKKTERSQLKNYSEVLIEENLEVKKSPRRSPVKLSNPKMGRTLKSFS